MAGDEEFGPGSPSFNMTAVAANDTLTCAARNIQGPIEVSFSPVVFLVARCLLVIYFMLVAFFGTLLNCFTFYLVCRYKKLRTLSFTFAIQIVAVDLFGSSFIVTVSLSSVLANQWLLGEGMCIVTGALFIACNILRTAFLMGLVVDRFCSVYFAFTYPHYQVKVLWCFSVVTYLVTAVLSTLPGAFDCFSFSSTSFVCRIDSTCSPQCAVIRQLIGLTVYLPLNILPVILYSALFYKGRKARNAMRVAANISASEAHKAKKDWRATITFFLMFMALFLVRIPPGLTSFIVTVVSMTSNSTESVWFFVLNSMSVNVFILAYIATPIFILRNRDVREIIAEIKWIPFLKVIPVKNY